MSHEEEIYAQGMGFHSNVHSSLSNISLLPQSETHVLYDLRITLKP